VDGDGIDEILSGPGPSPSFGSHVKAWNFDGTTVAGIPGIDFFAFSDSHYGVTISAEADFDGDGRSEIITGPGPDPSAHTTIKLYEYNGSETEYLFPIFDSFGWDMRSGVNTAAGRY
jgi:hypothetical protein